MPPQVIRIQCQSIMELEKIMKLIFTVIVLIAAARGSYAMPKAGARDRMMLGPVIRTIRSVPVQIVSQDEYRVTVLNALAHHLDARGIALDPAFPATPVFSHEDYAPLAGLNQLPDQFYRQAMAVMHGGQVSHDAYADLATQWTTARGSTRKELASELQTDLGKIASAARDGSLYSKRGYALALAASNRWAPYKNLHPELAPSIQSLHDLVESAQAHINALQSVEGLAKALKSQKS